MQSEELKQDTDDVIELHPEQEKEETTSYKDDLKALKGYMETATNVTDKYFLNEKKNELKNQEAFIFSNLKTKNESDRDIIQEKLDQVTMEELQSKVKTKEGIEWFYTDDNTGEVLDVSIEGNEARKLDFKREMLIYLKYSNDAMTGIDEEQKKLDTATAEAQKEIKEQLTVLSDNILLFIDYLKDKVDKIDDSKEKKKLLNEIKYIESGFTLEVFNEKLDKFPTMIKHTLEDIKNMKRVSEIGGIYKRKLGSNKVVANLFIFVEDDIKKSFEATMLLPEDYPAGMENLFVFSLIRFFAMQDWNNYLIRKLHSSIIMTLKKLKEDEFEEEVRENVLTAIKNYLARFK